MKVNEDRRTNKRTIDEDEDNRRKTIDEDVQKGPEERTTTKRRLEKYNRHVRFCTSTCTVESLYEIKCAQLGRVRGRVVAYLLRFDSRSACDLLNGSLNELINMKGRGKRETYVSRDSAIKCVGN